MASYHLLVVDDNHEIRRMVTATLKTLGPEIDVLDVPSAEEALFISASLPLDLIVLDFRLPGMSGLEMVDRLRKRKPGIKIILVTGVEDEASRQQVRDAGVAAYFFKPIEIAAFLEAVKGVLWSDQVKGAGDTFQPGTEAGIPSMPERKASGVETASPQGEREPVLPYSQTTLAGRVSALQQQLHATSVLLIDTGGQVVEVAGKPSLITSGSILFFTLLDAFHASLKASEAISRGGTDCMLRFSNTRQQVCLTPVDASHALLVETTGYTKPDKLSLLERAVQLAAQDLRTIFENPGEAESPKVMETEASPVELTPAAPVEVEVAADIAEVFSQVPQDRGQEQAEDYWESLDKEGALDVRGGKGVLSYDEAQKMGLTPDDEEQP